MNERVAQAILLIHSSLLSRGTVKKGEPKSLQELEEKEADTTCKRQTKHNVVVANGLIVTYKNRKKDYKNNGSIMVKKHPKSSSDDDAYANYFGNLKSKSLCPEGYFFRIAKTIHNDISFQGRS